MEYIKIVLLCVIASIIYGIVHDMFTAHICVEYFTIFHPPIFGGTQSPVLLALGWGVIATWWMGVLLGIPLAVFAQIGSNPKRDAESLVRPLAILLVVMAICAITAGIIGFNSAKSGDFAVWKDMASKIPPEKHVVFLADLAAHNASYAVGTVGAIVLMITVAISRAIEGKKIRKAILPNKFFGGENER
jgi:hypothetical protein